MITLEQINILLDKKFKDQEVRLDKKIKEQEVRLEEKLTERFNDFNV